MEYAAINLDVLQQLAESNGVTTIDKQFLISKHLINKREMIKILGRGEITIALAVHAHKFSATAKQPLKRRAVASAKSLNLTKHEETD